MIEIYFSLESIYYAEKNSEAENDINIVTKNVTKNYQKQNYYKQN